MRSKLRGIGALACVLMLATAAVPQAREAVRHVVSLTGWHAQSPPVKPGDRFPEIRFSSLDGRAQTFSPASMKGTVVFNVFTSWCPSCRAEAPAIRKVAETLAPRGVRFVGVDQAETPDTVRSLVAQLQLPYDVVIDPNGSVSKATLGARMIPTTVVVKDGRVTGVAYGPLTETQLRALVGGVE